jgi:hypothetical protein
MVDVTKLAKSKVPGPLRDDEIADLVDAVLQEDDPYRIPPELIPEGYSVEWKRLTVMGARAPNQTTYELNLAKTRWEAVNVDTHPSFKKLLPPGYTGQTVEKEGLILMIRPTAISEKVREIQKARADNQLQQKLAQLGATESGEAPRKVLGVKRSYEPNVEVPND